ncbi:unnamed protein product [Closterium sp. NIES-64]|nr:unnamed protein product [Closterium sp. NIES-65]CAI5989592.1 unnamed protein product [Closterium sp. NIES-64]
MTLVEQLQNLSAPFYRALSRAAVGKRPVPALPLLVLAVVLSLAVWAAPWLTVPPDMLASPGPTSAELYEAWAQLFALDSPFPPSNITLRASLPPPPHLEDCAARTAFRLATERTGGGGTGAEGGNGEGEVESEAPEWARATAACGNVPQPPWVSRWLDFP